jgi:hypothetical protein
MDHISSISPALCVPHKADKSKAEYRDVAMWRCISDEAHPKAEYVNNTFQKDMKSGQSPQNNT